MFKYTPPWQVLCTVLESQRLHTSVLNVQDAQKNQITQETTLAKDCPPEPQEEGGGEEKEKEEEKEEVEEGHKTSPPQMHQATSSLVFSFSQNPDPKYEEQNGVEKDELRCEAKGDEYLPLEHTGNGTGMIGPQGYRSTWETTTAHQWKGLWTPPPDRESKLNVVKVESLYSIRAYKGEKKPSRLHDDDEEERYKIPPEEVTLETVKELEEDRRKIIKSQVVRRSNTMAERWSSMDELDAIHAATLAKEAVPPRSYSTGFAICFNSPSPNWVSSPVDPENIDTEQINFAAARQQFLDRERANSSMLVAPRKRVVSPRVTKEALGRGHWSPGTVEWQWGPVGGRDPQGPGGLRKRTSILIFPRGGASEDAGTVDQNLYGEYLGSTLGKAPPDVSSVDLNGKATWTTFKESLDSAAAAREREARDETPIEREIRLSMEREQNFWKERGMQPASNREELVEIHAKPLLLSPVSSPTSSRKGKEKARASLYIQREIEQESKREENLQKERKLLQMRDGGSCPQPVGHWEGLVYWQEIPFKPLKFVEQPQPLNAEPVPAHHSFAPETSDGHRCTEQMMSSGAQACRPSPAPDAGIRQPADEVSSSSQTFASSNQKMNPPALRPSGFQERHPGEEFVLRKEHFAIPIRKIRFLISEDQSLPRMLRQEQRFGQVTPQQELYTLKTWRARTSALIDQEIQEDLQRELELQAQRKNAGLHLEMALSSPTPSQSSAASGVSGSYSVSSSPTFVSDSFPDRTSLAKSDCNTRACQSPGMRQREAGKYAGIEPTDEIDNEVVNATKVICHRGLRAQLWESGQIHKVSDDAE